MESYLKQSAWNIYNNGQMILFWCFCPAPGEGKMKENTVLQTDTEMNPLSTFSRLNMAFYSSIPI